LKRREQSKGIVCSQEGKDANKQRLMVLSGAGKRNSPFNGRVENRGQEASSKEGAWSNLRKDSGGLLTTKPSNGEKCRTEL